MLYDSTVVARLLRDARAICADYGIDFDQYAQPLVTLPEPLDGDTLHPVEVNCTPVVVWSHRYNDCTITLTVGAWRPSTGEVLQHKITLH